MCDPKVTIRATLVLVIRDTVTFTDYSLRMKFERPIDSIRKKEYNIVWDE